MLFGAWRDQGCGDSEIIGTQTVIVTPRHHADALAKQVTATRGVLKQDQQPQAFDADGEIP